MSVIRPCLAVALLLAPASALAQCIGAPVTAGRFALELDEAEHTVATGDVTSLELDMAELALAVPCLSEVVGTGDAARLHLLSAVQADPLGSNPGDLAVVRAVARYKELRPGLDLPPDLIPLDHGVRVAFAAADGGAGPTVRAPQPRDAHLVFDGVTTRDRPTDRPSLFQLVDETGLVRASAHLLPGDPLPDYRAVPRQRNTLWIAAGACAVASGAAFAGAWATRGQFDDVDGQDALTLQAQARTTNALVVVSATFGAAALGLGGAGFAVGER